MRTVLPILLCLLGSAAAEEPGSDARARLSTGLGAYSTGDAESARTSFEAAAQLAPDWPAPWFNLGVLAHREGRWSDAISALERYLVLAPEAAEAPVARVRLADARRQAAAARTPSEVAAVHLAAARSLLDSGDRAGALTAAASAAKADPTAWQPRALAGTVHLALEDWSSAEKALAEARERAPPEERDRLEAARSAAARSAQAEVLAASARAAFDRGDARAAAVDWEAAWRLSPSEEQRGLLAADAWLMASSPEKARAILVRLATNPRVGPQVRERLRDIGAPPAGSTMILVEPADFVMGSPGDEPGRDGDEVQHRVVLSRPFLIGSHEVTQREYQALIGVNPVASHNERKEDHSRSGDVVEGGACAEYRGVKMVDPDYPVVCVSWVEAATFANALSRQEGLSEAYSLTGPAAIRRIPDSTGYRLPTEAEWEWAARGPDGTTTLPADPPGLCARENTADERARARFEGFPSGVCDDGAAGLARVGSYLPNRRGIYDMLGNAAEWTEDYYGRYPSGPVTDPTGMTYSYVLPWASGAGASNGGSPVVRGGAWLGGANVARPANRGSLLPMHRANFIGFRLVRTAP